VPALVVDPAAIPPEVQLKAALPANHGRPTLMGPGRLVDVTLSPYRAGRRRQELVFDLATDLTREYASQASCEAPPHVLFPQLVAIVERYLKDKVYAKAPGNTLDVFLAPLLRVGGGEPHFCHSSRHGSRRGARAAAVRVQPGTRVHFRGGLLDDARGA
jgi:hypothetical protein